MGLFILWHESASDGRPIEPLRRLLAGEAHVVPEAVAEADFDTGEGRWHLSAFCTGTRFYAADRQVWTAEREACVIHGLLWRIEDGRPRLLDAAAVARLLARPGDTLPDDVAGEFAVARLHGCGAVTAFSDRAGLHQLFHGPASMPVVANRAGLIATLIDDWSPDPGMLAWLPAIGYLVGRRTAYRAVTGVGQEQVLVLRGGGMALDRMRAPVVAFPGPRGLSSADPGALDEGIAQATAAIALAAGADGPVDLPITGGKDSRVVLALSLAAGLHERLRLFTRGYEGHPDVVAGRAVAAAMGLPHRREPPHGSDLPAHWTRRRFLESLMAQAYQTDGMVGGWDLILGERVAADTLLTGHMGEVLKAYAKRPVPPRLPDAIEMVRLQAPFDPMGLLRPAARAALAGEIEAQMRVALAEGALPADLPDIFYYRNRVPNWLGAIRAIKSFERQPVVPLGVPALQRLAFRMLPEERASELLHYRLIAATTPALLAPPFALQRWDERLGPDVPRAAPIGPGAVPVFGNWQYSPNHNPAIREAIAGTIRAHPGLSLWNAVDADAALERLGTRRFDYFDGISFLGLVAALLQESAMIRPRKIGSGPAAPVVLRATDGAGRHRDDGSAVSPAAGEGGRPIDRAALSMMAGVDRFVPPAVVGRLEPIEGGTGPTRSVVLPDGTGDLVLRGRLRAPDWPAVQVAVEARSGDTSLGIAVADLQGPDGQDAFALNLDAARIRAAAGEAGSVELTVQAFDSPFVVEGGRLEVIV